MLVAAATTVVERAGQTVAATPDAAAAVTAVHAPVAVAVVVAPAPVVAAETTRGCMRDHHLCATRFSFS